jgi:hypothetical protein
MTKEAVVIKVSRRTIQEEVRSNMRYVFKSQVGTFSIEPDEVDWDMVQLCIGGLWLCTVATAAEAAARVAEQKTGWNEWDVLTDADAPADLSGWEDL